MLRKPVNLAGIFLLAATAPLGAGEKSFWLAKPSSEWNEKEVEKLLKNSPWSKSVTLSSTGFGSRRGGASDGERDNPFPGGTSEGGSPERGGGADGGQIGAGRGGGLGDLTAMPSVTFGILWYSRPVREAQARSIQIKNPNAAKEQLDRILNSQDSSHFVIFLMGWNLRMEGTRAAEALQKLREETYLLKRNRERVPIHDYVLPTGPGQPLVLRFAREAAGRPTLTLEDKEVELVTKVGGNAIRARFKLADMVIKGQLEL